MSQATTGWAQDTSLTPEYLSQIASEARSRHHLPAVAVTVMNRSGILHREIQGVRVSDRRDAVSAADYFHIGSCAKSVLSVVAATLIEQGRIAWNTRLFEVFPELHDDADPAYADVTLEHLLASRAGIKAYTNLANEPMPDIDPEANDRRYRFVRHLIRQAPAAKRKGGEFEYLYSNAGYSMAAAMLERVSGRDYETLVRSTLHDAGLAVHVGWPNLLGPDQPWGHMLSDQGIERHGPDHPYRMPDLLMPAGDLSMTPDDYAEYTRLHLRGARGEDNLISHTAWHHIQNARKGFALGVYNGDLLGREYLGMDGSAGTFFCRSIIVPEADFAFTIMTNLATPTGKNEAVEWLSQRIVERRFELGWLQRNLLRLLW
ncbi:MAG: serine hydrolase [Chromatiales bacterium]|nr:serine hydrolase [Chromatiales bacterium]MDX9766960.1 serine hydrolase domain-containing protein [Ectothiorhodospiraceae bacterium]